METSYVINSENRCIVLNINEAFVNSVTSIESRTYNHEGAEHHVVHIRYNGSLDFQQTFAMSTKDEAIRTVGELLLRIAEFRKSVVSKERQKVQIKIVNLIESIKNDYPSIVEPLEEIYNLVGTLN